MARIFLGYVHPGQVTHEFFQSVLQLIGDQRHQVSLFGIQSGVLISKARNEVAERFLEEPDAEYFLSVDTDIYFEPEVVDTLLEADLPIASALYYSRDRNIEGREGRTFVVGNVRRKDGNFERVSIPLVKKAKKPVRVDGVGMGCCLVKREVIEKVGARPDELWPFADTVYEGKQMGEDITFCIRAAELGYNSYIVPAARVGHKKAVLL